MEKNFFSNDKPNKKVKLSESMSKSKKIQLIQKYD